MEQRIAGVGRRSKSHLLLKYEGGIFEGLIKGLLIERSRYWRRSDVLGDYFVALGETRDSETAMD